MRTLVLVIDIVLTLYVWVLLAAAVRSLLIGFKIVDAHNRVVVSIGAFLDALTEPARRPVRKILPDLRDVDISPIMLIVLIVFIRYLIALYVLPLAS
jgi:YggT family protein